MFSKLRKRIRKFWRSSITGRFITKAAHDADTAHAVEHTREED